MIAENQKIIGVPEAKVGEKYYFQDDLADQTIDWQHLVRSEKPNTPWFAYVATGCSHAPHHVPREWSDKYSGKFDQGWDVMREQTFARQKALGVIPADAGTEDGGDDRLNGPPLRPPSLYYLGCASICLSSVIASK